MRRLPPASVALLIFSSGCCRGGDVWRCLRAGERFTQGEKTTVIAKDTGARGRWNAGSACLAAGRDGCPRLHRAAETSQAARGHGVPLVVVDNAYGAPFPGVFGLSMAPVWDERVITALSSSKAGLPGERLGYANR